jgi:hypothetical protein
VKTGSLLAVQFSSEIDSLQAAQFGSGNYFAARTSISVANATSLQQTHFQQFDNSLQATQFRQRITISLQSIHFR